MAFTGSEFPSITVETMNQYGEKQQVNLVQEAQKQGKKIVLFWYPKDFTFVCPTELHAFSEALPEFEKRNTLVYGASVDTPEVHFAWLNTPKDQGGIEGVQYPIVADSNRNLSSKLQILDAIKTLNEHGEEMLEGDNVTYRATFLIDEEGVVFHEAVNHMPVGRNVNEFLRIIDAYAHVQEHGEVCPANWEEGKEAMTADSNGVASYLANH